MLPFLLKRIASVIKPGTPLLVISVDWWKMWMWKWWRG